MSKPLPVRPERIKIAIAIAITGESERTLQALAAAGRIPGAARLSRCWTFNERQLRQWVMYGRRPRCKRELTFLRSVRVRSCIRPVFAWRITSVAMQPLWPLALM